MSDEAMRIDLMDELKKWHSSGPLLSRAEVEAIRAKADRWAWFNKSTALALCDTALAAMERLEKIDIGFEIRALTEERDRLREALRQVRDMDYRGNPHPSAGIARAALEAEE